MAKAPSPSTQAAPTAKAVAAKTPVRTTVAKKRASAKSAAPARKPAAKRPVAAQKVVPVRAAAAKTAIKPKAAPANASAKSAAAPSTASALDAGKLAKDKKPKMVRDSVTIPKAEYMVLDAMKQRAAQLKVTVKKTELIRAGMKHLATLPDTVFLAAIAAVPSLKTGRPSKA